MRKYTAFGSAVLTAAALLLNSGLADAKVPGKPSPKKITPKHAIVETNRMAWWSKARFGMFIHWGVYSVPAGVYDGKKYPGLGEWLMHDAKIPVDTYQAYAKDFNPTQYDPEKWVLMAKAAGIKYIVITTKHHDGFAMFDSKASDWNIVQRSPYHKDVIKMLADACRKYGMKLGFYYSQANDWNNAGGAAAGGHWDKKQDGSFDTYLDKVAIPQIKEILNNYGDVAELWWDVPTDMTKERAAKITPLLAAHPEIITNNRLGGDVQGDLETPEQYIPATGFPGRHWETCMTMNDTWGYKTYDDHWKSSQTLIRNLVDIASKGGNYLLNIGPKSTGEIPQPIVDRLKDMGDWMKVNSEAIYGTTASPFKKLGWGRCTTKEMADGNTTLYLQVFNWPTDGQLLVPGLKNEALSAKLLANGSALKFKKVADGLSVSVPSAALDENATVIKLVIKGKPDVENVIPSANADGSFVLSPADADTKGGVQSEHDIPNLGYWTSAEATASWQIKITKPGTYNVEAPIGAVGDGNKFTIKVGNQILEATAKATGNDGKYVVNKLGQIKIDKAGLTTITVTPIAENWEHINMRAITFKPVQ
ncbi:alpha-L-fucosidase [Mucilaginibacter sp. dw_454]|uniref:alpha-L-fucosidase n=1 Tax=Mucilaginibacter sp. dw_454 TaxID=2720079 RepID=UPI001BD2D31D|nr:alpha-L-fucosidase [Mucilaginibacter sp. dw_454]